MIITNQATVYNLNIIKPTWNLDKPILVNYNDIDKTTSTIQNDTVTMVKPNTKIYVKIDNFDNRLDYNVRIQNNGIFSMRYNKKLGIITIEEKYTGNAITRASIVVTVDHEVAVKPVSTKIYVVKQDNNP